MLFCQIKPKPNKLADWTLSEKEKGERKVNRGGKVQREEEQEE